jgi:hypothetical protein
MDPSLALAFLHGLSELSRVVAKQLKAQFGLHDDDEQLHVEQMLVDGGADRTEIGARNGWKVTAYRNLYWDYKVVPNGSTTNSRRKLQVQLTGLARAQFL